MKITLARPHPLTEPSRPAADSTDWRRGAWRFARHYVAMVAAMYVGMVTLSPVYSALASRAGYPDPWVELPVLSAVVMAAEMTAPMALLMLRHRHRPRAVTEMGAAMLLPALAAAALQRLGLLSAASVMTIAHLGMFPAMFLAMALRYPDYARPTAHRSPTLATPRPARRTP